MKKLIMIFILCVLYLAGIAQDFPAKPGKLVNDYTNTLSSSQLQQLENKLIAFDDSTSTQIAIAIVKSIRDYDINEYTLELGRRWGVGNSDKNNGIMIVVALGDRKISIQTGYGLEGVLPDVYAKRIIETEIKPHFKNGNYYAGLEAGTDAIIRYTRGEYKNDQSGNKGGGGIPSVFIILVIIAIIIIILRRGGGGGRGGHQVIGSRGMADALFWSMLLGSGRRSGGRSGWGGSSGGGGFGGFGGGSFGGGGSSGSW